MPFDNYKSLCYHKVMFSLFTNSTAEMPAEALVSIEDLFLYLTRDASLQKHRETILALQGEEQKRYKENRLPAITPHATFRLSRVEK